MTIDWAEWGPPLGVLIAGLAAGAFLVSRARQTPAEQASVTRDGERADLAMRHQQVVQALKDLELDKDKLSPDDYARERQGLLTRGADAMRRLDAEALAEPVPAAAPTATLSDAALAVLNVERQRLGDEPFRQALATATGVVAGPGKPAVAAPAGGLAPEWRGALYAFAVFAVIAMLVYAASGDATMRAEGGSMTGNQDLSDGSGSSSQDDGAEAAALEARVTADPKDVEAINRLTVIALSNQDAAKAMEWNEKALAVAPNDLDARTYRGVLSAMMGMIDKALETFDSVLAESPEHPMALVYKGLIALESGKPDIALPALEKALALGAANPQFLGEQIELARRMQAGGAPAMGAPAMGGPAAPVDAEAAKEIVFTAKITIDAAAEATAGQAKALYVSVKDPAGGPPVAAKRLPPGPFPMEVTVTAADKLPMAGNRPIPANVDVTIRLDFDGDAMSRSDGEPVASFPGLAKGTTGLSAVLK